MGTSVSHRSPATPNWNAVATAYRKEAIPLDRVVQEIWRAATNQPTGDLAVELARPLVAKCLDIAITYESREDAVAEARKAWALSGESSIAADLVQRAIVRSFTTVTNRELAFSHSLFAEAFNYLVSRDLSGYLGKETRIRSVSDSIAFKDALRTQVVAKIKSIPLPPNLSKNPSLWRSYVQKIAAVLAGRD